MRCILLKVAKRFLGGVGAPGMGLIPRRFRRTCTPRVPSGLSELSVYTGAVKGSLSYSTDDFGEDVD